MPFSNKLVVVGVGNPLRGDDGIGHWVGQQIEEWQLPGVTVLFYQQLQTELIEQWLDFQAILVVDAAIDTRGFQFEKIETITTATANSSHHIQLSTMVGLAEKLFNRPLNLTACKIGAANFELGAPITKETLENGKEALREIHTWIQQHQPI